MISTIIKKELKAHKLSLIIYCLSAVSLTWLYVALFPSIKAQSQEFSKLIESYPEAFREAFGIQANSFSTLESFLSVELFSFMWPLLAILLMSSRAGHALAGEIERSTIGTLLAQPLSRIQLFLSKYVSGIITLTAFIISSILIVFPLAWLYRQPVSAKNIFVTSALCFAFGIAVYSVAMALSAAASDRGRVYGPVGGGLTLMYILNIVASLRPELNNIKYASVFNYFNAQEALATGQLSYLSLSVFMLITALSLGAGLFIYNKRDISI